MLNLLGVKKLKIFSPSFSFRIFDSTGHTSVSPYYIRKYAVLFFTKLSRFNNKSKKNKTINEIEILIRDENHELVDFNNVWDMTLALTIYRKMLPHK
jgi:hypothetical protein